MLTNRMKVFAKAYAAAPNGRQAALAAGYAETDAANRAHRLLARDDVQEAIRRFKSSPDTESAPLPPMSPLDFLMRVSSGEIQPTREQLKAAIAAAPYVHAKAGAQGKKADAKDRAADVVKGAYKPGRAPTSVVPFRRPGKDAS